jgi:hypothetical protein
MQLRLTRTADQSRTGHMKIVRVPSTVHAVPRLHHIVLPSRPQPKPDQPQFPSVVQAERTPAARARRAQWKIRRLFKDASRAAKGQVRLRRADEYELLRYVYAVVRRWRDDGIVDEIERELRAQAEVAVSRSSTLFLLPLRSALPRLDPKRASKWGVALAFADDRGVSSKRLALLLRNNGGIEGAARQWAGLRGA